MLVRHSSPSINTSPHNQARFMRPNTPHLVLTPEASICHGGHFYASSTLRSTCHSILHTFVASTLLTNTEHTAASRELLRRLLCFYCKAFQSDYVIEESAEKMMSPAYKGNIPNVYTFEGLIDVLSLCNLMEMGNIIHYKTYTRDGMSSSERRRMIAGRAIARQVRSWLAANVEIHHLHDIPNLRSLEQDVFYPYLSSQVAALLHYKRRAPTADAQGHVEFQFNDLVAQIKRAFHQDARFKVSYDHTADPKTFDWVGTVYQVRPVNGYTKQTVPSRGENFDDLEWLKAQQNLMIVGSAQPTDQDEGDAGEDEVSRPPRKRGRV